MIYVLIIHEVKDYAALENVFNNATSLRKKASEISYQVLKYISKQNKIVHFAKWNSHENARKFFESPKLVQIRLKA